MSSFLSLLRGIIGQCEYDRVDGQHAPPMTWRTTTNNNNTIMSYSSSGSTDEEHNNQNNNRHHQYPVDLIHLATPHNVKTFNVNNALQLVTVGDVVVIKPYGFGVYTAGYHYTIRSSLQQEQDIIHVTLPWANIAVPRSCISLTLPISVISFVDNMPGFQLSLKPNDKLYLLKEKIAERFEIDSDKFRIAYKGVEISENNFKSCFVKEFFHNCCSATVLFVLNSFIGMEIEAEALEKLPIRISSDRLSAEMKGQKVWCTFKTNKRITKGRHSWRIKLEKCTSGNITVGLISDGACRTMWAGGDSRGLGYLGDCSLWQNGSRSKIYGETFRTGDTIDVNLDMDQKKMSYSINGKDLGIAFDKFPKVVYPAVSLFDLGDSITFESYRATDEREQDENIFRIKTFKKRKLWIDLSYRACAKFQFNTGDVVQVLPWPFSEQDATVLGLCISPDPYSHSLVLYSSSKNGAFLVTNESLQFLQLKQKASRRIEPAKRVDQILSKIKCK